MTSYLLNQDGGYFLLQDGSKLIISSPVISEDFRVVVKNGAGVALGEFDTFRNLQFGKKLNTYGMAQLEIPLNNSKVSLISTRVNTIEIYNKVFYEQGQPDEVLVWAGEMVSTSEKFTDNGNDWVTLYCYTWLERFIQRLTAFERIYSDVDAGEIAYNLIDESQRGVKNTGWHSPTVSSEGGDFTTPDNAFLTDENFATCSLIDNTQYWENFNLNIPTGATIDGIEIKIKGKAAEELTDISVGVYSDSAGEGSGENVTLGTGNSEFSLGSSVNLFGLGWTAEDFADDKPLVYISTLVDSVLVSIDWIQVKVYYTINDANYDFGITRGEIEPTLNRDRKYNNDVIADKIVDLANVNYGFDFDISDLKVFNVYSVKGEDLTDRIVLELGKNIKGGTVTRDFKNACTKAIVLGSAYGEDDIQRVEVDDSTKQDLYKVREQKYTEMDEVDTSNFTDRGQALLDKYGTELISGDIDIVSASIHVYDLNIGDLVRYINRKSYKPIDGSYRIFEYKVIYDENNNIKISIVLGNYTV